LQLIAIQLIVSDPWLVEWLTEARARNDSGGALNQAAACVLFGRQEQEQQEPTLLCSSACVSSSGWNVGIATYLAQFLLYLYSSRLLPRLLYLSKSSIMCECVNECIERRQHGSIILSIICRSPNP
jgi:hypothetical protein